MVATRKRHIRLFTITRIGLAPVVIPGTAFNASGGSLVIWMPRDNPKAPQRAHVFGPGTWSECEEGEELTPVKRPKGVVDDEEF